MPRASKDTLRQRDLDNLEWNKAKKIKAEALIKQEVAEIERLKKEKLQGSLISIKDTEQAFLEIVIKTKANLQRLVSELPPKLEGLKASDMIEIIRTAIDEVCLNLSVSFLPETSLEEIQPEPDTEDEP